MPGWRPVPPSGSRYGASSSSRARWSCCTSCRPVFRTHPSTISFYDGWVGNLAYFGCAAARRPPGRAGPGQAAGRLDGDGRRPHPVRPRQLLLDDLRPVHGPGPVPVDPGRLLPALLPGRLPRASASWSATRLPGRGSRAIWLDGIIAALGVAALEAAIVIAAIARDNVGDLGDVATNFAYPIGDLVLVTMLVAVFAVQGWRPDRLWWTLGAGLALFAVADSVYSVQALAETYVTGTVLDSLWMIGTFLMAIAAWQPRTPAVETGPTDPAGAHPGAVPRSARCRSSSTPRSTRCSPSPSSSPPARCWWRSPGWGSPTGSCRRWPRAGARPAPTSSPACPTGGCSTRRCAAASSRAPGASSWPC